ncbi:MAG: alpha/beta fold hydrolase [Acidimicrobiia bacterium]
MGLFKGLIKTGLVVGGIAGAVYVAERLMIQQLGDNPDPEPGWRPQTPDGELSTITTDDGTSLRVISEGEGSPIVLVHGLLVSLDVFALVWDDLVKAGHRVIGVDLRGHGGSTVGDDGHGLDLSGDDLATLVRELDLHDAVIVGHSMGGMAALSFAVRHPDLAAERVSGLVIANSAAGGLFDAPQNQAQLALVKAGFAGALINHEAHGKVLSRLYFGPKPALSQVAALNEMHASQPPETIVDASAALERYELHDRLDEIKVPTLVISSEKDGILPSSFSERIAAGVPGSRLEVLEGVGHMSLFEAPEAFVDLVTGFVAEVATSV